MSDYNERLQKLIEQMFLRAPANIPTGSNLWMAYVRESGPAWAAYGPMPPAMCAEDV